jgi:two-component system, OmpR family, sensor kinase
VSRLPIRVKLAAAYAVAMVLVLAGVATYVYVQQRAELDETIDERLDARATAGISIGEDEDEDDAFVETARWAEILTSTEWSHAHTEEIVVERQVPGIDGTARVLARPRRGGVIVVGESLEDRDETLAGLLRAFAIGGGAAVLLASLLGYALATGALRPVDAMRRRAESVSFASDERLPLPRAQDEIHRLGVTLNDMLARLRGSYGRERQFVADASHELRTPIAVIKAELEGALRSDDARPAISAAIEECDHLAHLAEDLLVLARDELEVRPERQDAREVLEAARARFAERAERAGRTIRVDAADGATVEADPLRLRQALNNLVDNALRHGEGDVTLAARDGALEVADEGPGFGDLGERAFERFTRGDAARTRGGAGLGLAIVRAIAEAHGGSVAIDGARVRIWLGDD